MNQNCEGRSYLTNFREYILPQTDVDLRSRLNTRICYSSLEYSADRLMFNLLSNELSDSIEAIRVLRDLKSR